MSFELTLSDAEITKALAAHVKTLGIDTKGKHVTVALTSTRKPVGYSAVVTISDTPIAEQSTALENLSTADAAEKRQAVIKQTGTDALGHAAELTSQGTAVNVDHVVEADPKIAVEDEVDLPQQTAETVGHESGDKKSLFD